MTAPFRSEKQPLSLARWLGRRWPIATSLAVSLSLHGALLFIGNPAQPNSKIPIINARLTTDQAQKSDNRNQLPLDSTSPQIAQPETKTNHVKSDPPEQNVVITKTAAKPQTPKSDVDRTEEQPEKKITEPTQPTASSVQAIAIAIASASAELAAKAGQQSQPSTQQEQLKAGKEKRTSDPVKRRYQDQVLAHIRNTFNLPAYTQGKIRLQLTFNYSNFVTHVAIVNSSGDKKTDDMVKRAVFAANPFPAMPKEIEQPYIFNPTIDLDSP